MSLFFGDEGLKRKMADLATAWNATALKLHLYKNNYTPTTSSVVGDFTEADFAGYAAQDIVTWGTPTVASHVCTLAAAANTFTRSTTGTAQSIYGYYATNAAGSLFYWGERDPSAPRTLTNAGDSETITPKITDQDLST